MPGPYYYGSLIRVSGEFTDSDGNLTDPAAVYCAIRDPAGTIAIYEYGSDPEIVKDAVGQYHADVDCDDPGWWSYRFYGTGAGQAAGETRFRVYESEFD